VRNQKSKNAAANEGLSFPFNPLLPKALWISTSLSFACKASYIGPKQHGYMLPTTDDAFHQELMTATACAGDRDRNEKGVKFSIFN
jgi:hypothetical protein